jgi:hypothetical protein
MATTILHSAEETSSPRTSLLISPQSCELIQPASEGASYATGGLGGLGQIAMAWNIKKHTLLCYSSWSIWTCFQFGTNILSRHTQTSSWCVAMFRTEMRHSPQCQPRLFTSVKSFMLEGYFRMHAHQSDSWKHRCSHGSQERCDITHRRDHELP